MRRIDLTGQRFGRLCVKELDRAVGGIVYWRCGCSCGAERIVSTTHLRSGHTQSCGCSAAEKISERNRASVTHGMSDSLEYGIWRSMLKRCHVPSALAYARYGGRGIHVCDEWRGSFSTFYKDVGPRPSTRHSLERIDNQAGYHPGNVKWATDIEQNNNRRNNVTAVIDGVTLTAAQIARKFGIRYSTVLFRIRNGRSAAEITAHPVDRRKPIKGAQQQVGGGFGE